jgi:hypothetical protein
VSLEHFFGQVAGESHRNHDGTDRQTIISRCTVGEPLILEHEPDNPYDINAIRVLRRNGEQIGYLERAFAGEVVSRTAKGHVYRAAIADIGRPQRHAPYGVALLIIVDDGSATDEEAATYAHEVLSRDRAVPMSVTPNWLVVGVGVVIIASALAVMVFLIEALE